MYSLVVLRYMYSCILVFSAVLFVLCIPCNFVMSILLNNKIMLNVFFFAFVHLNKLSLGDNSSCRRTMPTTDMLLSNEALFCHVTLKPMFYRIPGFGTI